MFRSDNNVEIMISSIVLTMPISVMKMKRKRKRRMLRSMRKRVMTFQEMRKIETWYIIYSMVLNDRQSSRNERLNTLQEKRTTTKIIPSFYLYIF